MNCDNESANIDCHKDMQVKLLEEQLHEQYAINNNSNFSTFISFLVSLLVLFGGLGYAFVSSEQSKCFEGMVVQNYEYQLLCIVASACLTLLAVLAITLGYSHRRDEVVIYHIRKKYYTHEEYTEIFGKEEHGGYSPSRKGFCEFIPDVYNVFYWAFLIGQVVVFFSCTLKMDCCSKYFCISMILQFACFLFVIVKRFCLFGKYKDFLAKYN